MNLFLVLKCIFLTIVGSTLILLIIPLILPLVIILGPVSLMAQAAMKLRYGNTFYKADAMDVIHGKRSAHSMPIINIGLKVKGKLDLDKLRERMFNIITKTYNQNGVKRYPKFMEMYTKKFGYRVWKRMSEGDFKIENHVRLVSLEELKTKLEAKRCENLYDSLMIRANGEDDWGLLMKTVLEAFDTDTFQEGRPPWEMLVVKNSTER